MANVRGCECRSKLILGRLSLLLSVWIYSGQAPAELLGRISDDTAPAANPAAPAPAKPNDRKIIYRVICSPEEQDLPDCDRPTLDDGNEAAPAATLAVPDFPPESEAAADESDKAAAVKQPVPQQHSSPRKKSATHKKAAKKTSAKKSAAKKRSRK
ncbi:hypothetical protein QZJ86_18275 [Methylomonas montana]|uniref:hypothetical protein n=1 Tax=Methylomonas montana TaxID=3058963 RepID=UPI00265B077B|nr:hypothetical protein [Methylomonas montana]WKJ89930.1 hypothetical protein QZJ86_18275 [Methylomonas montana]